MTDPVVCVPLSGGRDYRIHVGRGRLADAGGLLSGIARSRRVVVITQPLIAKRWARPLLESLRAAGFDPPDVVSFPAGERYKTLATVARLYGKLYNLPKPIDRKTLVVALGGGVVGDVAGFVAASYLRGLDYAQVPTTLLAMVDSSVGGKTGVDFLEGKNLVGAFHQPRIVIADTETLGTLPARELRSGMAEIIKYGIIHDPGILPLASSWGAVQSDADAREPLLVELILRSCAVKSMVVAADEREETGLRAILNYGHTIGHALEAATGYRRFKHGEAVAIGMVSAACIGEAHGVTPPDVRDAILRVVREQSLPVAVPSDITPDALLALLGRDKKAESGVARFVLARLLGKVELMSHIMEKTVRAGLALQDHLVGADAPASDGTTSVAARNKAA